MLHTQPGGPTSFPCLCIPTYHARNSYVMCIASMQPYFSQLRQFRRLLCVAAMSSLAQLRVWDGYGEAEATKMRQHKADREQKCQKWAATRDAYRVTNQQRMAVRRAIEWIRMSKAQLVFRYEISGSLHLESIAKCFNIWHRIRAVFGRQRQRVHNL